MITDESEILPQTSSHVPFLILVVLTIVATIVGFTHFYGQPIYGDQYFHTIQIEMFAKGDFTQMPRQVAVPGYHAGMTILSKLTGLNSLDGLRLLSFLVSIPSVFIAYLILYRRGPQERTVRAAQILFLPMLLPLVF